MLKLGVVLPLISAVFAPSAFAQEPVATALSGVLRGCESWVLDPANWIDGPEPSLAVMDLGEHAFSVETIPEFLRPPPELRHGNRYWRIDATDRAGFALTVSDELPMCHVVGIGFADFGAAVDDVLSSPTFAASWEQLDEAREGTGRSLFFRHRDDETFVLTLSQPGDAPDRRGGINLLATAVFAVP